MIRHGHVAVNGKKESIPSYLVRSEMIISSMKKDKSRKMVERGLEAAKGETLPPWIACDSKQAEIRVLKSPGSDELSFPIQSNLIVELLAK